MNKLENVVNSPKELTYVRGWCYQDQLGPLDTYAPHVLPSQETLPNGVTDIREQEITRAGFIPTQDHAASYLYRANPGPAWSKDGAQKIPRSECAPYWVTGRFEGLKMEEGLLPRKYAALSDESGNPIQALKTLFYNQEIGVGVSTGNEPMPYFFRNADGDDLYFVHEGAGYCETELGVIGYEKGHFVYIPRGIAYRLVPTSKKHVLFHNETYGEKFQKPETGFTGDAACYYHRNIEVPTARWVNQKGEFQTVVKSMGEFTAYTFPFHPMDVVGWDGDLFPFRLHIKHINPITSWRAHIPPSAYCTFFGSGFEICSFVPRPVETGERALPVPFDHINIDRDEVIFYSQGVFFSKTESREGTLTFHPRGISHGPHPSALQRESKRRDEQGAFHFEGYFILVETNNPLVPTPFAATIEDKDYINSWL